jgi:PEP-CTERM motif
VQDPTGPQVRVRRRRPTRRHLRNRLYRRVLLASVFILGGLSGAAVLPFNLSSYLLRSFLSHPAPEWKNGDIHRDLAFSAGPETNSPEAPAAKARPVYPYSLVPGGVHDPKELEQAFEHDPVLAAHYRGFDFRRARLVQLTEDKTVYVSYRIAGHVYWTTKKVRLHRGEKVITDGKMTLRTRCGNQVSETARQEVSPKEPPIAKMEEPMKVDGGSAVPLPVNFDSALTRPNFASFGPVAPGYSLIANSGGLLTLFPPPLPVCGPGTTKKPKESGVTTPAASVAASGKKKKNNGGCGSPTGEVPEPSTWALFASGLAGAWLRYRKSFANG